MKSKFASINIGFGNCVFLTRNPMTIETIIKNKVNDLKVAWSAKRPTSVKVEPIDDLHDKLSLSWDDYKTEGVITWRPSKVENSKAMVFCNIE